MYRVLYCCIISRTRDVHSLRNNFSTPQFTREFKLKLTNAARGVREVLLRPSDDVRREDTVGGGIVHKEWRLQESHDLGWRKKRQVELEEGIRFKKAVVSWYLTRSE